MVYNKILFVLEDVSGKALYVEIMCYCTDHLPDSKV